MLQFKKLSEIKCLEITLGENTFCRKFDKELVKHIKDRIIDPQQCTLLCKENIDIMEELKNKLIEYKSSTTTDFINAVKKNPFCLFSECNSEMCILSRTVGKNYIFRSLMESYIIKTVKSYWTENQLQTNTFTYLSYGTGFFLQDIIILTLLHNIGMRKINLILIADPYDYLEYVCNPEFNKLSKKNLIDPSFIDDKNIQRKTYMELYTIRINLFLDYLSTLGIIAANTKIFASSHDYVDAILYTRDKSFMADLFIGIDHSDEMYNGDDFYITSTIGTKPNGFVFSLQKCMKCYPSYCILGEIYQRPNNNIIIPTTDELNKIKKHCELCISSSKKCTHDFIHNWKCLLKTEGISSYMLSMTWKIIPMKYIIYGLAGITTIISIPFFMWKFLS